MENIKKYRKEKRLSQMTLAERCGTATSYIGEIEIGRKFPSIDMIQKIADALQIDPHLLFKEIAPAEPEERKITPAEYTAELQKLQSEINEAFASHLRGREI